MGNVIDEFMRITDGIAMADVIGWVLAALAGILAYKVIDTMNTSMSRHGMLREVEKSFSDLFNSPIARKVDLDTQIAFGGRHREIKIPKNVFVRSVLHDDTDWEILPIDRKAGEPIEFEIVDNQRYVHIRDTKTSRKYYDEWISTQALHELLTNCRRIEKMYKDGIIKRIDLADMYREILPLGKSGRLEFFNAYYNEYDAECIAYLVLQTVVSCNRYKNKDAVDNYFKYYTAHEEEIGQLFSDKNRRKRRIRDEWAFRKFKKLASKCK